MNSPTFLLEARGIQIWRAENLIVDEITVQVPQSGVVQIQGSNGSGKTTLLRAIVGLAEIDEGDLFWLGEPIRRVRDDMYSSLLYLGHKPGISAGLTPYENLISLCPEMKSTTTSDEDLRQRIMGVLAELGIADRIDLPSVALSAGQQRRVALARLKLQDARLWVLDEPLTSLDAEGQGWVKRVIEVHVKAGGAVVFTTHQPIEFDDVQVSTVLLEQPS
jgi:heme exporter protein A